MRWTGACFHRYEGVPSRREPFLLATKPDSTWNQYGESCGGPTRATDRFFFGAFEGYRQETLSPPIGNVPTPRFRRPRARRVAGARNPVLPRPVSASRTVGPTRLGVFIGPGAKRTRRACGPACRIPASRRKSFGDLYGWASGPCTGFCCRGRPSVCKSLTRRMSTSYRSSVVAGARSPASDKATT